MRNVLARVVDIREGEGAAVLKATSTLFCLIAAHTLLETARDALFLEKLPARRLPIVYLILAALAFVVSTTNARVVERFGRRNALLVSLLASAYGTMLLYFLPQTRSVVFGLYLWSGLLGAVLATQFWIYAGQLFTVAQGRRLFGLIGGGGVAGAIGGASAAVGLVSVFPVPVLLPVASGLFLATAALLTTQSAGAYAGPVSIRAGSRAEVGQGGLALFREFPYLRKVALALALATAAALVTDYLFKSVAAATIPKGELGLFFARTYAVFNAAALAVQIGLAGAVIRRLGVVPALAVVPLAMLTGGVGTLVVGGALLPALLTKGADGSLRHSLHRVANELAWLPLPARAREGSKEFLETAFGRGVQALSAGALLLIAVLHVGTPRVLSGILVVLAAAWIVVVLSMRRPYVDLLRQALSKGSLESFGPHDDLSLGSMEALLEALSSRDPSLVLAAMDLLVERKRTRLIPGLVLYHEADEVLLRALEVIAHKDRSDWIPLAERLFSHPKEDVRVAAVRALSEVRAAAAIERALMDPCPAVRTHAAFSLVDEDTSRDPIKHGRVGVILAMEGPEGRAARLALLDAIYDRPSPRWADVILALAAEDDPPEVALRTTRAMGRVRDARFVPILIRRLAAREGRGALRDAIVSQGDGALEALAEALFDPATEDRVRIHIPRTIARFRSQRAADLLTDVLLESRQPGTVRYKALRGLARLAVERAEVRVDQGRIEALMRGNLVEHLRIMALLLPLASEQEADEARATASGRLLLGLLEDKRAQSLGRAFRLLQILHRSEDIRSLEVALRSEEARARASALELLDALLLHREGPLHRLAARRQKGEGEGEGEGRGARAMRWLSALRRRAAHHSEAFLGDRSESRELFRLAADDLADAERVARAAAYLPAVPASYEEALAALLAERDLSLAAFAAYHALELGTDDLSAAVRAACKARPSLRTAAPVDLGTDPAEGTEGAAAAEGATAADGAAAAEGAATAEKPAAAEGADVAKLEVAHA